MLGVKPADAPQESQDYPRSDVPTERWMKAAHGVQVNLAEIPISPCDIGRGYVSRRSGAGEQ